MAMARTLGVVTYLWAKYKKLSENEREMTPDDVRTSGIAAGRLSSRGTRLPDGNAFLVR
jgi:hypothetical protein